MPSFLEALKQCAERQRELKASSDFIEACMKIQFKNDEGILKQNMDGQRKMRMETLVNILKDNEDEDFQNIVKDSNSKKLIINTLNLSTQKYIPDSINYSEITQISQLNPENRIRICI